MQTLSASLSRGSSHFVMALLISARRAAMRSRYLSTLAVRAASSSELVGLGMASPWLVVVKLATILLLIK
jgi:hypothetical protein